MSPLRTSLTGSSPFSLLLVPSSQWNRNRGNWSACLSLRPPSLPAPSSGQAGWLAGWRESWFYLFFCLFGKRAVAALGLAAALCFEQRAGRPAGLPGMRLGRRIYFSPAAVFNRAEPGLPSGPWGVLDSLCPVWQTPCRFWGDQSFPCL